jgi:hypothetical protein
MPIFAAKNVQRFGFAPAAGTFFLSLFVKTRHRSPRDGAAMWLRVATSPDNDDVGSDAHDTSGPLTLALTKSMCSE